MKTYKMSNYGDMVCEEDMSYRRYSKHEDDMSEVNETHSSILDTVYNTEGYNEKPIDTFISTYLTTVGSLAATTWLVRNSFFTEAISVSRGNQSFYSTVCSNISRLDKAGFEKLLSICSPENQVYMLCKLHENGYRFTKKLYTKSEFLKKFEGMCADGQKVFEMPVLKKRPNSGAPLKSALVDVFVDLCTSERMFDKWVGKNTTFGDTSYHSFNVKDESKFRLLKKWVGVNSRLSIRVPKAMKTQEHLIEMLDIFLNSRHKRNGSNTDNIERILDFMGKGTKEETFDKDLFEQKVFETAPVRKSLANGMAKRYADSCPNYLAYKKL